MSQYEREHFLNRLKQGEIIDITTPWFDWHFRLHFLQPYLEEPSLEEIIVHHPRKIETISAHQHILQNADLDPELWNWVVCYLCLKGAQPFHLNQPFASLMISLDQILIRASFIHEATLPDPYHKAFFRLLPQHSFPLESFSPDIGFLQKDVESKKNILISGSTGSGKTSLLKTLFHHCARSQNHLITIEDTHELQHNYSWVTSMVAKDHSQYSMEQYLTYAMRMRPERIILGEIRSREVRAPATGAQLWP